MTEAEDELKAMVVEFTDWCAANGMPDEGDAEELLHKPSITPEQRAWLSDFILRWQRTQERADREHRNGIS